MQEIKEGSLRFNFPDDWQVAKYDETVFYQNFKKIHNGIKAIDILAVAPDKDETAWLIEIKDYRTYPRTKSLGLAEEISQKILYTLAALLPAKLNANKTEEQHLANTALQTKKLRVVLHLEQPVKIKHSRLFPRVADPADLQQKLRIQLKAVDAHPKVVNSSTPMPWQVAA